MRIFSVLMLMMFVMSVAENAKSADDPCLSIAYAGASPSSAKNREQFESLFKTDDFCTRIVSMPNQRAKSALISGRVDGEIGRVASYQLIVGDAAVRIPTPVLQLRVYVLTNSDDIRSTADLRGRRVGHIHGFASHETVVDRIGAEGISTETYANLIRMLAVGRVDAMVIDDLTLRRLEVPHNRAIDVGREATFLYLHKRNTRHVAAFDRIIREHLKKGGSFIPAFSRDEDSPEATN